MWLEQNEQLESGKKWALREAIGGQIPYGFAYQYLDTAFHSVKLFKGSVQANDTYMT